MSAAEVIDEWRRMYGDDLAAEVERCTSKSAYWLHREVGWLADGDDVSRAAIRLRKRLFWRKFRAPEDRHAPVRRPGVSRFS